MTTLTLMLAGKFAAVALVLTVAALVGGRKGLVDALDTMFRR